MKVIAWDVGIKNLAYCIVEKADDRDKPYIIHQWEVINLTNAPNIQCCYHGCLKGNEDIKTYCAYMGTNKYFCKEHKTYHNVWKNNYDDYKKTIKETKEGECSKCGKKAKWVIADTSFCTVHRNAALKKWDKEIEQVKFSPSKIDEMSVDELKLRLLRMLDSKPMLLQGHHVCIENQPTLKNPRMKAVSDTIYAWFLIRGILDKDKNNALIQKVSFIAPSSKLKIEGFTEDIQNEIIESDNKYKTTKALAVQHTRIILKNCPQYLARLEGFKKKDDAADAFLHGVHYLSRH
jgi:hypothetical protein